MTNPPLISNAARGFTLIETLVAIMLVTIAMLGPYQVVQRALNVSYVARDQLIASSLAEEALEYTRAVRDRNFLYNMSAGSPRSWFYSMDGNGGANCAAPRRCVVDPTQNTIAACAIDTGTPCPRLYLSNSSIYTQVTSGTTQTRFTRYIQLTSISSTEMQVTVTVTWITNTVPYSVTVTDTFHNWL